MSRPCVPGSVLVEGATGSRAYGVNGFYEPTEEMYNGLPCYKKKVCRRAFHDSVITF